MESEREDAGEQRALETAKLQRRLEGVVKERETLKWVINEY